MSQTKTIGLIIVVIILLGIAGAAWREGSSGTLLMPVGVGDSASSTPTAQSNQLNPQIEVTSGTQVKANVPLPVLSSDVTFSGELSPEIKQIIISNVAKLRATLAKDPGAFDGWLNLALQYKMAGDYDSARKVWEYTSAVHPGESTSLHNLGDLYFHYLKDYGKAEMYFKKALAIDPGQEISYIELHELYRYAYRQDTTSAVDILNEALGKVGSAQSIDVYTTLASYYASKNDKSSAITAYTKARGLAQQLGNTAVVAQIDASIAELEK